MKLRHAVRLLDDFERRRLPKARWTHEAHLVVCRLVLERLGPDDALAHLRHAIRSYNEATGTRNTDTGGYHETLTRYYVRAVAAAGDGTLDDLVAHPACSRTAPLAHWSRARLFSTEARRAWVPPDVVAIPWWPAASGTPARAVTAPAGTRRSTRPGRGSSAGWR